MARILILQEMEQNIINLKAALLPRGHELIFVRHELKALERLQHEQFDLIICAVYLQESDVFDFTKAVKHHPTLKHIPLVFYCSAVSSFARSVRGGLKIAAETIGVDLYLTMEKFDPEMMATQIETCLKNKQEYAAHHSSGVQSAL
ncbi:MAG TPA: hypothetical protein V6C97_08595 [Oculatellaceae cyanobacterium]